MIAAFADLIVPVRDILPVPAPPLLLRILLMATFLLHLLAMNTLLGGLSIAFVRTLGGRRGPLVPGFLKTTPTLVAVTVTLGVAPLLFLQTLMGRFFFTSSILVGWGWFSVVVVLIAAYYGSYLQAFRWAKKGRIQPVLLAVTLAGFLWIAFMFSNNTSLMAAPATWGPKYFADPRGLNLNLTDPTLVPRYLHAVLGAVALAGLVLAWWGDRRNSPEEGKNRRRTGLKTFTLATAVNVLLGMWYLTALPRPVMKLFMGGSPGATAVLAAGLLFGLAGLVLGWRAWRQGPGSGLGLLTATILVVMVLMVVMRDLARAESLGGLYRPADIPSAAQWLNMGIFLILLMAGIGMVAWMARRLAQAPDQA